MWLTSQVDIPFHQFSKKAMQTLNMSKDPGYLFVVIC